MTAVLAVYFEIIGKNAEKNAAYIILGLVALVAYVTVAVFVARSIKYLETREAPANDYSIDVLWIAIFFPFGLWFLQPRLNNLGDQFYH
jgi:hypothetical protein